MGLTRHRSLQVTQRDADLLPRIQQLKAEPPFWGDRRRWAYLHVVAQLPVHKKRMLRLMREPPRLVTPNLQRQAKRPPTRSTPSPTTPHDWGGLARTKVRVEGFGGVYLVLVLDWDTKKIVGY